MEIFIFHQSLLPQDLLTPFVLSFPIPKDVNFNHPIRFCDPHNRQHSIQSAYSLNWMFPIKNVFPIVLRCYECLTFGSAQYSTWKEVCMVLTFEPLFISSHTTLSLKELLYICSLSCLISVVILKKGSTRR